MHLKKEFDYGVGPTCFMLLLLQLIMIQPALAHVIHLDGNHCFEKLSQCAMLRLGHMIKDI